MTHYQVLGVRRDADLATIRAAYLHLIKQHHPDRTRGADTDQVYRINIAYSILRDPARRSDYNSQFRNAPRTPPWDHRLGTRYGGGYSAAPGRGRSKLVSAFMVLACFAAFVPGDTLGTVDQNDARASVVGHFAAVLDSASREELRVSQRQPDLDSDIRSRVEIASYATLEEANGVSRRCFARLNSKPLVSMADRCIAFDLAFAYWFDGEFRGWPREDYFLPTSMTRRHRKALSLVGIDDPGRRIEAIRGQTFASIFDILSARRETAAAVGRSSKEGASLSSSQSFVNEESDH